MQLIRIGQQATVRSPAIPHVLTGTVVNCGVQIYKNDVLDVDPAADADARVVEVRVRLDRSELAAKWTNLQVNIQIRVDRGDVPGMATTNGP